MAETTCPNCGNTVPDELGQHAGSLVSGSVSCPSCGTQVTLRDGSSEPRSGDYERAAAAPPGHTEGDESFSGHETGSGLAEELREKSE